MRFGVVECYGEGRGEVVEDLRVGRLAGVSGGAGEVGKYRRR